MLRFLMVFVACMAMGMLFGCGQDAVGKFCNKVKSCAAQDGEDIDVSECTRTFDELLEEADDSGCGTEFEEYLVCLETVSCDDLYESLETEEDPLKCRAKGYAFDQCIDDQVD